MPSYLTLRAPVHIEVDPIKRSRFFADAAPVQSEQEALAFIATVRDRFPDAGHHCSLGAYSPEISVSAHPMMVNLVGQEARPSWPISMALNFEVL